MEREDIVSAFMEFLKEYYYKDLAKAVTEGKRSIAVDFKKLDKFNPELADLLLEEPEDTIALAEKALTEIDLPQKPKNFRLRFFNLPESRNVRIRNLRVEHLGKLLVIDGIVKRATEVRPEVAEAIFECPECGNRITVIQTEKRIKPPIECECGARRGFKLVDQRLYDARWIVVEEPFEITTGERPSELTVYLKEDLTEPRMQNKTDPGNRIKIVGILKQMPRVSGKRGRSRQLEIYLDANYVESVETEWEEIEISPEDEKRIKELAKDPHLFDKLIASIAPSIYGMNEIKEAIILQLFGGETHYLKDGTKIRGEIHILLVGDPACLVADERVVLGDGTIMKIGKLGKSHLQRIKVPVRISGRKRAFATTFHIYRNQPVIEIITESGKSLKGTPNQPVLVVNGMEREWKRLDELKVGDRIAVITSIPCWKKSLVATNWKLSKRKYGPKFRGRIPEKWSPKLAAFVGYLIGDGYIRKDKGEIVAVVNENEKDLIKILVEYIRDLFALEPKVEKFKSHPHFYKGRLIVGKLPLYSIVVRSKDLASCLSFVKEKRVPDEIFLSPNNVVREFLRWLFEADGCVFCKGRGRRGIQLKQKEIELLRDVQMLLLRFGIHSRIYENNLTIRRGYDIIRFAKKIGFPGQVKRRKLMKLAKEAEKFKRVRRQRSEKVVKIRKIDGFYTVYDIEVPRLHRFIANGIIVHNSGKSRLMQLASRLIPRGKYVSGRGVTGAGLCVSYDTLVPLVHGQIKPIGEIVENALKIGKKRIEGGWVSNSGNVEIWCLDPFSLKLKRKKVSMFFKLKPRGDLIKITTRTGREIKLTMENPVLTIGNGEIVWKQAKDVKVGDYIAMVRTIPINELPMPELPRNFARFLGMVIGDGDVSEKEVRFHNKDEEYLRYVSEICKSFGLNPRIYYQKNRVPCVRIGSKSFCKKLTEIGIPRGKKSDKVEIPEKILLSNELLAEFISGLFDCDGSVIEKKNGGYIEYT
ncbi:MAG TPA: hypothetical protein ENG45_00530, partial [Candidatus Aenigmarchaeota archaeon]|nr:hypothetical protein [Candidatus Aenigmarchaeota archaeon]